MKNCSSTDCSTEWSECTEMIHPVGSSATEILIKKKNLSLGRFQSFHLTS